MASEIVTHRLTRRSFVRIATLGLGAVATSVVAACQQALAWRQSCRASYP